MSARDLIQQRITLNNGDTKWQNSSVIEAALNGDLLVLGIIFFKSGRKKFTLLIYFSLI